MSFLAETHLSHEKRCQRKYYTLRIKRNTFWENIHSLRPIPDTSPGSFPNHRNNSRQKMYMFRSHHTLISSLLYFGTTMASSLMSFLAETHLSPEKRCWRKYYTWRIHFLEVILILTFISSHLFPNCNSIFFDVILSWDSSFPREKMSTKILYFEN